MKKRANIFYFISVLCLIALFAISVYLFFLTEIGISHLLLPIFIVLIASAHEYNQELAYIKSIEDLSSRKSLEELKDLYEKCQVEHEFTLKLIETCKNTRKTAIKCRTFPSIKIVLLCNLTISKLKRFDAIQTNFAYDIKQATTLKDK